ncbi:MAG: hypothetical protein GY856_21040, partial [bacterium]|nr:hypothetical protein [bacterium]
TTGWSFRGTEHFIRETPRLRSDRVWLLRLFEALRASGRDAMLQGLRGLEVELDTMVSWWELHRLGEMTYEMTYRDGQVPLTDEDEPDPATISRSLV